MFLVLKGTNPYKPFSHNIRTINVGRHCVEISWTTYSKRRWLTRRKYKGVPTVKVKFKTPRKCLQLDFLLRSEQDIYIYLHSYFITIANISQDCPKMLGGKLTHQETDFMVKVRLDLTNDPYSIA